jgi:hypothetical protein
VSPPAGAAAPAVPRRRTVAPAAPRVAPRAPRRVSGPARRTPERVGGQAHAESGLALGVLAAARGLSRHRLDRLIRGRAWIALIAFGLIGIVALQLLVLKLNASIGRTIEHEARLERQNAALSIESSELAAGNRVEARASALGMQLVPVGSLRFLSVRPGVDAGRAAAAVNANARAHATALSGGEAGASSSSGEAAAPGSSEGASGASATQSGEAASGEAGAGASASGAAVETAASSGESGAASSGTVPGSSAPAPSTSAPASGAASAAGAAEAAPADAAGTQSNGAG